MERLSVIERQQIKSNVPPFRAGDTIRVHIKVAEGGRDRLQAFEGVVIGRALYDGRIEAKDALAVSNSVL